MKKVRHRSAVPDDFTTAKVRQLAAEAEVRLPAGVDVARLAAAIRAVAETYVGRATTADSNIVHHEIAALYNAARRHRFGEAARLIEALSERTRAYIGKRRVPWKLPAAGTLRDKATRDAACADIMSLLSRGGHWRKGRLRLGGKRPMVWEPLLYAPVLQKHPPKRAAERDFIVGLQWAWLDVVGQDPPMTADRDEPGPFVKFAAACLHLVAPDANFFWIINRLHERRKQWQALVQLRHDRAELLRELKELDDLEQLLAAWQASMRDG